jgi:hypothetical protein
MLKIGSQVTFAVLPPWVSELPAESQRVYAFCLGRTYRIVKIDEQGLFVLDVSPEVDHRFGGYQNDIRLEGDWLLEA